MDPLIPPLMLTALLGCPHPTGVATPHVADQVWDVAVVVGSGERVLSAVYELQSTPAGPGAWTFSTRRTVGTWEEAGQSFRYDSATPNGADPWPLSLQHLVAAVPATVSVSETGRPTALLDPDGWTASARSALYASDLPVQAVTSGEVLVDPDGLIADLARTFPGSPTDEPWRRSEAIAGVMGSRIEQCARQELPQRQVQWSCLGTVQGPDLGPARLHGVQSTTVIITDRHGLVQVQSTYSGTRIVFDATGQMTDRPIAGRRLVERR